MPLYYTEKKTERLTQAEYLKRQREASKNKPKLETPASIRPRNTAAKRKRDQETHTRNLKVEESGKSPLGKVIVGKEIPVKTKKKKGKTGKPKSDEPKTKKITKPSGKFSKTGQKKVEAANARNAGINIMGAAGGENSDKYGTQARGAGNKFRGQGTGFKKPKETIKSLDLVQTNLSSLLQVMKQEKRDEVKAQVFKSLDDSMSQLKKELNS